jgi:hypothetical protein
VVEVMTMLMKKVRNAVVKVESAAKMQALSPKKQLLQPSKS